MRDALGQRGENLFNILITPFHGNQPLFRPQFLGDKWPVFDFFVEDAANRQRLWDEVKTYWEARPKQGLSSQFFDSNWR